MTATANAGKTVVTFFRGSDVLRYYPDNKIMEELKTLGEMYRSLNLDWDSIEIYGDSENKDGVCVSVIKHRRKINLFCDDVFAKRPSLRSKDIFKQIINRSTKKYTTSTRQLIHVDQFSKKENISKFANEISRNDASIFIIGLVVMFFNKKYGDNELLYRLVYTKEEKLYVTASVEL